MGLIPIFLILVLITSTYPLYYAYAQSAKKDDSDKVDLQTSKKDDSDKVDLQTSKKDDSDKVDLQTSNKNDGHNTVKEKKDHHDCSDGKKANGDGCEPQCTDSKKGNGDGCEPQCTDSKKLKGQCIPQGHDGTGCVAPQGQNVDNYETQICLPPISDAGPDKQVSVGDKIKLDGSGSKVQNENGKIVSYQWKSDSEDVCSNAKLTDQDKSIATFITQGGQVACNYTFDLQVTDDKGLSDSDQVTVHTKSTNSPTSNQTRLHIDLSQRVLEVGKSITLSGLLSQGNGKTKVGLGGEMISFTGKGPNYPNVPTQSDGSFSVETKSPLVVGNWDVQGHISGESKFGSISSNTVKYRTEPIHIEAGDITFQHEAKKMELNNSDIDEHDLSVPLKQAIKDACKPVDGRDFNDKLNEIQEDGGHLKYDVKDKSIQKTIYYELNFSCNYSILSKLSISQLSEFLPKLFEISPSVTQSLEQKKVN